MNRITRYWVIIVCVISGLSGWWGEHIVRHFAPPPPYTTYIHYGLGYESKVDDNLRLSGYVATLVYVNDKTRKVCVMVQPTTGLREEEQRDIHAVFYFDRILDRIRSEQK